MVFMNAESLRKLLNVRPFEPVEVELSSGQVFAIKHPENVIVLNNTLRRRRSRNGIGAVGFPGSSRGGASPTDVFAVFLKRLEDTTPQLCSLQYNDWK
jgi:hypothetical protein